MRDNYLDQFFNAQLTMEIRELWNFSKHRGSFYFESLGDNDSIMTGTVNGLKIPLVYRRKLDIEKLVDKLIDFDVKYFDYLKSIIEIIMPKDFISYNNLFESTINYYMNYKEQLIEWNKK